ncbi:hypothetical protein HBH98_168580 [Parastagonospora nodorum]|nr:hypothetical protein HBH53_161760 [Parastagonospora nodorum]KAH4070932.1 hypothetical protein HBH50_091080 [Parastagonospora nodorum]KAH4081369.1 hypothetical protein HBH46_226520 [Parastagonospora nodorum]KAH4092804.1 hypothetical protein HBH48_072310 [Parastagonospora nodorum]KAH4128309.1 hypothetical protein HBH45_213680 [Parastagonospora nodorum]
MDSPTSPLMRLPKGVRKRILVYALRSQYIRYHNRKLQKPAPKTGAHARQRYYWAGHYRSLQPPFRIYDPRTGHDSFRWLSSLMSLSLVSRQLRKETGLLLWEVNVFHISLDQLPHFVDILPREVIGCVKHIGILDNAHLMEHIEKFTALKKLPALTGITLVKMGGVKTESGLELVVRAIKEYAGKEYSIVGV